MSARHRCPPLGRADSAVSATTSAGKCTVKVDPFPGSLSTETRPSSTAEAIRNRQP